jgi:glutamate racemase
VLRHIRAQLPYESLCYFADSGFAPYGDKSESEIMQRTLYGAQSLLAQGAKAIVIACNTATAAAIALLRSRYPNLIIVGVEPGLKPAASLTKAAFVGVIATSATLASAKYQLLCNQIQQTFQVRFIHQACPGLADQIERGEVDSPATLKLLTTYLQPIFQAPADILVLGCTHYPFVENSIKQVAQFHNKSAIHIIDTGLAVAKQLRRLLAQQQLLNQTQTASLPLVCLTSGIRASLEFALLRLLKLEAGQFSIQETDVARLF